MRNLKTVLLILGVIIIVVGMFFLGRQGLNYTSDYSKDILISTAKAGLPYMLISTAVAVLYLTIKYNNQGIIKVFISTLLGIIGTILLVFAIFAISRIAVSRIFFSILFTAYVSSIMIITANFEENT